MREHSNCGIGVVANMDNLAEHQIIRDGLKMLKRLEHRGGTLRDGSGDGAGMMLQIPREFFKRVAGVEGEYYVAMTFLPQEEKRRRFCEEIISTEIEEAGLAILGSRVVSVRKEVLGESARRSLPVICQYFIEGGRDDFTMYSLRRRMEKRIYRKMGKNEFYFASFSNRTIVYKGLITPQQFYEFYEDLLDEEFKSAYVMIHQRFSTNTLPSWDLAHPFRVLEHNGEINTIAGNRSWIEARRGEIYSDKYPKEEVEELFPLTSVNNSDSANLDSVVEFLMHTGRKLPEILTTLVPQAWEGRRTLEPKLKKYYEAKSLVMEPWDGPAGLITSNGEEIFATLDRNGLRPMRYTITTDNKLIISSEMGVLDTEFSKIKTSGKLSAGEFLYLDLKKKRLLPREEIVELITETTDFREEVKNLRLHRRDLAPGKTSIDSVMKTMKRFSYTREDLEISIDYLQENSKEMVTSTTYDIPLAVLDEDHPRLFFDYFRQKFAQVTNPPIDSIREASVFSLTSTYGAKKNLLDPREYRGVIHMFPSPVVSNKNIDNLLKEGAVSVSTAFTDSIEEAMDRVVERCLNLARLGRNIILSDRNSSKSIPILLISSAVHHALIEKGLRTRVGIGVESGEIREIGHYALLTGYGVDIVNPYLVLDYLAAENKDLTPYYRGVDNGIKKIMSKMGISSVASYRGAKIFEAVGLSSALCKRYLGDTPTEIEGIGLKEIEEELCARERAEYSPDRSIGEFSSFRKGIPHRDSTENARILHSALKDKNYNLYRKYSSSLNKENYSLRNRFSLKVNPIPLHEVESEREIMKRFVAGAMSFGALSKRTHENIATVFNTIGAASNSGEGGENPERFNTSSASKIKQIASGRFGVTTSYLMSAHEIQIKMGQGAKPGEGGHLPGAKVNKEIARVRNTVDGIDLISPPPHHDIYSIEDLAQLIYDIKNLNTKASVSVKLASESGVGIIASGTVKAGADKVVISGSDGGTGAAMASSLKYAATPWELGISDTHKTLCENKLRDLVKLQVDGGIRTGYAVVVAALLGADEYAMGTGLLIAQGCIMCRRCHTNSCPVGITTQKAELQAKYTGDPQELLLYLRFIAQEVRELLATMGVRSMNEIIGRSSLLRKREEDALESKIKTLDFTSIFREVVSKELPTSHKKDIGSINRDLLRRYEVGESSYVGNINNTHRSLGTTLAGGMEGDSSNTHHSKMDITFKGYAGQSFGAFSTVGQTTILEGYGNDYVGKGLSGGTIAIKMPEESKDIGGCIAGNTVLYGATSGKVYLNGYAGERFAVRNSGASCVVEGIGNHGCEYMTGGSVIILGGVGENFGAGMSGGTAYLLLDHLNTDTINHDIVEYFDLSHSDVEYIEEELKNHIKYTESSIAQRVLDGDIATTFVKVASKKYLEKVGNLSSDIKSIRLRIDQKREEAVQ